ncbi:uncharacterized protein LOC104582058 [Brachypodium distachyon]|uniref:Late embryogenesis abundant protein LEA-2 subgroup domain-containing protein n=1 Tax=Brachypodium distachyon TaxID=15368 RepID=I1GTV5_BRADI|nr:uncharacterized protein LOC104582058 [Brachypodium distachyon]KQK15950.1 hypothetical protein BRADI_1g25970v3 [Brachypodium distachyon]|eukprot:XP_010229652.1 uncharacterized protein LOC104582058 [Brachypodium distachyon]
MARVENKATVACCGCASLAVALLLGVAFAAALYFAVLRPRPPRVASAAVDTQLSDFRVLPPALNFSLAVDVAVHNPGHAPFRHGEAVTAVTYRGSTVGRSASAPGRIPARSTRTVGARVQVDAARVVVSRHYVADVVSGALRFEARTAVAGEAVALRAFRLSADAEVACAVVLYPFRRESSSHCTYTVRITGI